MDAEQPNDGQTDSGTSTDAEAPIVDAMQANRCAVDNGGCEQTCVESGDDVTCSCNDGFALADDGTSCDDVDECAVANGGCAQGCENNVGGFACSCNDGFALADDGTSCDDVDECAVVNGGCAQGCENNVGGFTCSCNDGFALADDGTSCDDVDECAVENVGCAQGCENNVGGFACSCDDGFALADDGTNCDDVDECAVENGGCAQGCENNVGGFACSCNDGFVLADDGTSCDDVDECTVENGGCAQGCENNVGGFACSCNDGFALADDGTSCDDVDECAVENGGCAQGCENNVGGFACSCNDGFALADDGFSCRDLNVCGDGIPRRGEECDDGNALTEICLYGEESCIVCAADCTLQQGQTSLCGDGVIDPDFEDCDADRTDAFECPYGLESCVLCSLACTNFEGLPRYCGDGALDEGFGEVCDDGNRIETDGCLNDCQRGRPNFCTGLCDADTALIAGYEVHRVIRENIATPMANGFGESVALQGNRAVIGTMQTDHDINEDERSGTLTIYNRNAVAQWVPGPVLRYEPLVNLFGFPSGFGEFVAMDGDVIVAGVQYALENDGVVIVYEPDANGDWQPQVLGNPDRLINEAVGLDTDYAASIDVRGDWLAVGASASMFNQGERGFLSGAVYLFRRGGNGWTFHQQVVAPVGFENDGFGSAIALDGHRLVVGAMGMVDINDPDNTFDAGEAYIYALQDNDQWTFEHVFREPVMRARGFLGQRWPSMGAGCLSAHRETSFKLGKCLRALGVPTVRGLQSRSCCPSMVSSSVARGLAMRLSSRVTLHSLALRANQMNSAGSIATAGRMKDGCLTICSNRTKKTSEAARLLVQRWR